MAFDHTTAVAARTALAERLLATAHRYVPAGFAVEYRKSLSGRCFYDPPRIVTPRPVTRKAIYIFLHECGHAHLHRTGARPKRPRYVEEFEAEQFAHAAMRAEGIAIPREMTERAKRYVSRKIDQAFARGGFRFRDDIAIWATGSPTVGCERVKADNRWRAEIDAIIAAARASQLALMALSVEKV